MKNTILSHDLVDKKYFLKPERAQFLLFLASQSHTRRKQTVKILGRIQKQKRKFGKHYGSAVHALMKRIVSQKPKILPQDMCIRNQHLGQNGTILTPYSFTITCSEIPCVIVGSDENQTVRVLSPLEAERLQNFPADYTKYGKDIKTGEVYELSDSARYKAVGDAVNSLVGEAMVNLVMPEGGEIVSVFSGVNGTGSRLDKSKYRTLAFCELSRMRLDVINYHNPGAQLIKDIRKFNREVFNEKFDLLLATHPCQSFSKAGNRGGLEDDNGLLFFEVTRLLKEYKPRKFLCENVPGLIEHDNGETWKKIQSYIQEAGYSFNFKICNARDYGSDQNRTRVFYWGELL